MLTEEEKWELYYKKTVALLNENRSVWDESIEATRVLKLSCHKDALEHLRHLEREPEIALYTLWQLHSNKEDREMNCILGYLAYWRESNNFYCLRHCGGSDFVSVILFQRFTTNSVTYAIAML